MALQTSGSIALLDLANEFGGNTPHAINEYYKGGGLVPDTSTNTNIPTSGQITLNNFYGGDVVSGPSPGYLFSSGRGKHGRLGDGTVYDKSSPVQTVSAGSNWLLISKCRQHSAAIKSDGKMWGWGDNWYGQLGQGTNSYNNAAPASTSSPVQEFTNSNWETIHGGSWTAGGIKTDGRLWTWGSAALGAFGDNTVTDFSGSPVQTVSGGTDWVTAMANGYSVYGIKTDGRLWVWGQNSYGELGINNVTHKSSPVQTVSGGTNWSTVSVGWFSRDASAVKTDGRLWVWGINDLGRVGDNTTTDKSSPVQTVAGGTDWNIVSGGNSTMIATKTDGRLWAWGQGAAGSLGNNNNVAMSSPVQTVSGGTNWSLPAVSDFISPSGGGIKTDGRLWVWGGNVYGELGTNNKTDYSSPVQTVSGGTTWQNVVFGENHMVAIKT